MYGTVSGITEMRCHVGTQCLCLRTSCLGVCMLYHIMHLISSADLFNSNTNTNTNFTFNSYSAFAASREQVVGAFLLQPCLFACAKQLEKIIRKQK